MSNPQKQRFVHFYLYFRRYLNPMQSYKLAAQKVPEVSLTIEYLEQVKRSKEGNKKHKLKMQKDRLQRELSELQKPFWKRMWSKCGQILFTAK